MTATIANDVDLSDVMIGFFAKEVLSLLDVRRRFCGCFRHSIDLSQHLK